MPQSLFSHRLDLIVRLTDAVTGNPIGENQAVFLRNGKNFRLRLSVNSDWIGVNTGREDFMLGVNVRGFEKIQVPIRYEILDHRFPVVELPLVPRQDVWSNPPLVTLEGRIEGMEQLQAVPKKETGLYLVSYEEKEDLISLYNPHRQKLTHSFYAVVDQNWQEFEIVRILKTLPNDMAQIGHHLRKKRKGNDPLIHPVSGNVSENGNYLLRVPDNGIDFLWLVRCVVEGKEYFYMVDIRNPELFNVTGQKIERKG